LFCGARALVRTESNENTHAEETRPTHEGILTMGVAVTG